MAFLRVFSETNIELMKNSGNVDVSKANLTLIPYGNHYLKLAKDDNATLFALLKNDVKRGKVFPAVRHNELHFYYKGGCLFKFLKGAFYRDKNYDKYSQHTDGLPTYEKAKQQNENKYSKTNGESKERKLLDELYCNTFDSDLKSNVVVLDIEVNLKGNIGWGKKCDLVLLNTKTDEIMFVEGKVFSDNRVKCLCGSMPEVIRQVNVYTSAIEEQRHVILEQYAEHIRIINNLFGTTYRPPQKLIEPAKLLVYETDLLNLTVNGRYSIDAITKELGADNVMWVQKSLEPTLDEIWNAFCGEICR